MRCTCVGNQTDGRGAVGRSRTRRTAGQPCGHRRTRTRPRRSGRAASRRSRRTCSPADGGLLAVTSDGGSTWHGPCLRRRRDAAGRRGGPRRALMVVVGDGGDRPPVDRRRSDLDTPTASPARATCAAVASDADAHLVIAVDGSGGCVVERRRGLHFGLEVAAEAPSRPSPVGRRRARRGGGRARAGHRARGPARAWRVADVDHRRPPRRGHHRKRGQPCVYVAGAVRNAPRQPDRGTTWAPRGIAPRQADVSTASTIWCSRPRPESRDSCRLYFFRRRSPRSPGCTPCRRAEPSRRASRPPGTGGAGIWPPGYFAHPRREHGCGLVGSSCTHSIIQASRGGDAVLLGLRARRRHVARHGHVAEPGHVAHERRARRAGCPRRA